MTVAGIDAEIKTEYPYLIIKNGDDFINVTSDGIHEMDEVVLGSFYDVFVNSFHNSTKFFTKLS